MKKVLCLAAAFMLLLTGCSTGNEEREIQSIPQSFTADITICRGNITLGAEIIKTKDSICLSFTSPQEIDNLALTENSDGVTAKLSDVSIPFQSYLLPEKSALSIIDRVFSAVDGGEYSVKKQNGSYVYSGTDESFPFEIIRNCETFAINSISVSSYDVTINFDNFSESAA